MTTKRAALVAIVILLAACQPASPTPSPSPSPTEVPTPSPVPTATPVPTHTLEGELGLYGKDGIDYAVTGAICEGIHGYDDVAKGHSLSLYDRSHLVIGASMLDDGIYFATDGVCAFAFSFVDVEEIPFYQLEMGTERGVLSYSLADLIDKDWYISVTLGDAP
jgi:hypothetical protein